MRLLGFEIVRAKAFRDVPVAVNNGQRGGWWPIIREPYTGAWQQNVEVRLDSVLTFTPLFRCIALISSDIAKMRLKLVSQGDDGIWSETDSAAFSPVIRKPNDFQNRIQFFANWMESKLIYGNTYVLKLKDAWSSNYSGVNFGKVAVVGDGLKYEPMATKAVDAQLVDQAKWSAEQVGMAFGVPPYKLGVGPIPTNNNVEALDSQYYS